MIVPLSLFVPLHTFHGDLVSVCWPADPNRLWAHVANGDVRLEYLPTAQQPADALTKPVDKVKVSLFSQIMLGTTA